MNEIQITVHGNVGKAPELRYTAGGIAVCSFSVACTPRIKDNTTNTWKDGTTTWLTINCWRELAENVAETITKGMAVIAEGDFSIREWEDANGNKRQSPEVTARRVGPDLSRASAVVTKSGGNAGGAGGNAGGFSGGGAAAAPAADDPFAVGAGSAAAPF